MSTSSSTTPSAEINVTPLIDVLLVLLIIAMVMLPQRQRGEAADIPQPSAQTMRKPEAPLVIELHFAGESKQPTVTINKNDVAWDFVGQKLGPILHMRSERIAFLKCDPEVDFEFAAQVLDAAHHAGAARVGLL